MQTWMMLGILGFLSYAISTSIDKSVMDKGYSPLGTGSIKMLFDGIVLLTLGMAFFELRLTLHTLIWGGLLGMIYALSTGLYFMLLKISDVDDAIPPLQAMKMMLIFAASLIFLDESASLLNFAGVLLVVTGMYSVLSRNGLSVPRLHKGLYMLAVMSVISTTYYILLKQFVSGADPVSLAVVMYFSCTIFLSIFRTVRREKVERLIDYRLMIAAVFGALGTFLVFSAFSLGDASKVYPLSGLYCVFTFMLATLFLKERFAWHRLIGTLIVFGGIYLISL